MSNVHQSFCLFYSVNTTAKLARSKMNIRLDGTDQDQDLVLFTRGLIFQRFPRPRCSPAPAPCNGCNVPLCTGTTYCHGAGEGRHRSQAPVFSFGRCWTRSKPRSPEYIQHCRPAAEAELCILNNNAMRSPMTKSFAP